MTGFQVSHHEFAATLEHVRRESGRTTDEAVRYAMILMLTAGRSATPVGERLRTIEQMRRPVRGTAADEASAAADMDRRQFFTVYYQGQRPKKQFLPEIPRMKRNGQNAMEVASAARARDQIVQRFREIQFRGTAKASWGWALWKACGTRQGSGLRIRRRDPITVVSHLRGGEKSFIDVANALGWIDRLVPGIEQRMIASATNRMFAWLERRWQSGIDRSEGILTRRAA